MPLNHSVLSLCLLPCLLSSVISVQLGVVSYWPNESDYDTLPTDSPSLALINPNNGIINADEGTLEKFVKIAKKIRERNKDVRLLGYVPTGYGDRNVQPFETIKNQIDKYFDKFKDELTGIFFDEIGKTCSTVQSDMPILRDHVIKAKSGSLIAWNPGWVGDNWCYIENSAASGEVVVDFESEFSLYMNESTGFNLNPAKAKARQKGVLTWHIVHSAKNVNDMQLVVRKANDFGADFVYVTDVGGNYLQGDNTFGKPPIYWNDEKQLVKK